MSQVACLVFVIMTILLVEASQAQRASTAPAQPHQQSTTMPRRESYSERYGVLAQRNIFVRDRSRPRDPESTQSTTQSSASRSPEELLVLTGIVVEEDGFRAYAENQETLRVTKLALGDKIARGTIVNIDLDAVEYATGAGQSRWIVVGQDFTGRAVSLISLTPTVAVEDPATTGPASTQPVNPNDPNLSAEQKMRLRRQQEIRR